MIKQNDVSRVWDIIEKVRFGMLTTQFDGGLRARPLEARSERDTGLIWFVTDVRSAKDDEIDAAHDIGLVFIGEDSRVYLSITGRASVTRDTSKAKEIWKKTDSVWLPGGPNDPNMRLLRVEPIAAELWDGPSGTESKAFEFAELRLIGNTPNSGGQSNVAMPVR